MGNLDDIKKPQVADTNHHFLTEEFSVNHGDRLYINIKCVNNIELAAVKVATPIIISTQGPRNDIAKMGFIPFSQFSMTHDQEDVQSSRSSLAIYWEGFTDTTGIDHYECRLLSETNTLIDWTNTGSKRFVSLDGFTLVDGQTYLAEVRAVNVGNIRSEVASSTILIESRAPQLTGKSYTFVKTAPYIL